MRPDFREPQPGADHARRAEFLLVQADTRFQGVHSGLGPPGPGRHVVESLEGQTVVVRVPAILRMPARQLGLDDPGARARAALAFAYMEMVLDQLAPTGNPVKGTCLSEVQVTEEVATLWRYEDAQPLPLALAQLPPMPNGPRLWLIAPQVSSALPDARWSVEYELCLSGGGQVWVPVNRPDRIEVELWTPGGPSRAVGYGPVARLAFGHELDHLEGRTVLDCRAGPVMTRDEWRRHKNRHDWSYDPAVPQLTMRDSRLVDHGLCLRGDEWQQRRRSPNLEGDEHEVTRLADSFRQDASRFDSFRQGVVEHASKVLDGVRQRALELCGQKPSLLREIE